MSKKDVKKLDSLTNRTIRLMNKLYKGQELLTELKEESNTLLRKLMSRNVDKR